MVGETTERTRYMLEIATRVIMISMLDISCKLNTAASVWRGNLVIQ